MTVENVKSLIGQATKDMESASRALDEAATIALAAFQAAASATYDSQHTSVVGGLSKIMDAGGEADQIHDRLKGAIERADRYRAGL